MCLLLCVYVHHPKWESNCAHAQAGKKKNPSMPRVCVSVSQIVSHSVSSCVCVSAVAERK